MTFRFSGGLSSRENLPGKAPTAQLTRIDAAHRLVSVPLNTHNKCTGVCRFVCGIPVGIGRRVADLWGFCGARGSLRRAWPTQYWAASNPDFRVLIVTPGLTQSYRIVYSPGRQFRAECRLGARGLSGATDRHGRPYLPFPGTKLIPARKGFDWPCGPALAQG